MTEIKKPLIQKIIHELNEAYRFRYVTISSVQNNLKLRYRRSFLGFIWTLLAPMLHYIVIGLVFNILMGQKRPDYFVYYFSGALFFAIISGVLNRAPMIFIANEHFIKKIYVPKFTFILNGVSIELTNFLLSTTSLVIIGIAFGYFHPSYMTIFSLLAVLQIALLLTGISCFISVLTVYFRDFVHIVPVIVQALFFITPVIYDQSMIPEKYHLLLKLNPFYYYLKMFRMPLLEGTIPNYTLYIYTSLFSLLVFFLGLMIIKIFDNKIVFKL